MLKNQKRYFWHMILLFFTISVTVPLLPCGCIYTYGMFGEIKSSNILQEADEDVSDISSKIVIREKIKGVNIYNIWFEIWIAAVILGILTHIYNMPKKDTVAAKKVRMNN